MNEFKIIAKTLYNLEDVLAQEIEALGGTEIEIGRRMVSFVGNKALLYKANLRLRTALRILKPIVSFKATNPDELYESLKRFSWDKVMTNRQTFAVDTVVYSDSFTHSKYVGYRAKDAIVDYWRERTGQRPSVRLDNPDIYLNVHIAHNEVTVSLDSSGESLHKRGYRVVQTDAPINEVLAAGILLKAGWQGQRDLIDPMCGSGTFLIEAALIACNIAPGIYRSGFAFERWLDFDQGLFDELYNDDSQERPFEHRIYGSDILPHAIKVAERNIARAGLSKYITLEVMPMKERPQPFEPAFIVTNPPYGERLRLGDVASLYSMIGERLKHNFAGSTAWILAYRPEHFEHIGLRHSFRQDLLNGSLECELRGYELFAGKREDYKSRPRDPRKAEANRPVREPRSERRTSPQSARLERKPRGDKRRDERPSAPRGARANRPSRPERKVNFADDKAQRPKREDKARGDKKTLWPSDRFRYTDHEGRERMRARKSTAFQILKSEEDN